MPLKEYQDLVKETDQFSKDEGRSVSISFKNLRRELDYLEQGYREASSTPEIQKGRIGDIMWYIANLSNHLKIQLPDVVAENETKIKDLYQKEEKDTSSEIPLEKLPTNFDVAFLSKGPDTILLVIKLQNGEPMLVGDPITDNSHEQDFYRYHDVFHLAYLAHLNWSPVMRALFKRKRKSKLIEPVEDGARAIVLEEAISAAVFERAKKSKLFDGLAKIDFELLDMIKGLTKGLEVYHRHHLEWEKAILQGFQLFRNLKDNNGGIISVSSSGDKLQFKKIETDTSFNSIQNDYTAAFADKTVAAIEKNVEKDASDLEVKKG